MYSRNTITRMTPSTRLNTIFESPMTGVISFVRYNGMMKKSRMPKPNANPIVPAIAQGESSFFSSPSSSTMASLAEKLSAVTPMISEWKSATAPPDDRELDHRIPLGQGDHLLLPDDDFTGGTPYCYCHCAGGTHHDTFDDCLAADIYFFHSINSL